MKEIFRTLTIDLIILAVDVLLILFSRDFLHAYIPAPFDEAVYLAYFIALILLGFIMYAKISALIKGEKLIISTDERPYRCTGKTVCDNPGCTLCSLAIDIDNSEDFNKK